MAGQRQRARRAHHLGAAHGVGGERGRARAVGERERGAHGATAPVDDRRAGSAPERQQLAAALGVGQRPARVAAVQPQRRTRLQQPRLRHLPAVFPRGSEPLPERRRGAVAVARQERALRLEPADVRSDEGPALGGEDEALLDVREDPRHVAAAPAAPAPEKARQAVREARTARAGEVERPVERGLGGVDLVAAGQCPDREVERGGDVHARQAGATLERSAEAVDDLARRLAGAEAREGVEGLQPGVAGGRARVTRCDGLQLGVLDAERRHREHELVGRGRAREAFGRGQPGTQGGQAAGRVTGGDLRRPGKRGEPHTLGGLGGGAERGEQLARRARIAGGR